MQRNFAEPGRIVLVAVVLEGSLALFGIGLGWLFGHNPLVHWQWTWSGAGWGLGATLPPLALMIWATRCSLASCQELTQVVRRILLPYFADCTVLDFALVSIAAGVGEEVLFRGFLQAVLGDWLGPWAGLALASLTFGLAHFITPAYAFFATLLGLYLGGLWLVSDNLLAPTLTHAAYDFVMFLYLVFSGSSSPTEPASTPE